MISESLYFVICNVCWECSPVETEIGARLGDTCWQRGKPLLLHLSLLRIVSWQKIEDIFLPASRRKFSSSCCKRPPAQGASWVSSLGGETSLTIISKLNLSKMVCLDLHVKWRGVLELSNRIFCAYLTGFASEHIGLFPRRSVNMTLQTKGIREDSCSLYRDWHFELAGMESGEWSDSRQGVNTLPETSLSRFTFKAQKSIWKTGCSLLLRQIKVVHEKVKHTGVPEDGVRVHAVPWRHPPPQGWRLPAVPPPTPY